MPRLDGLGLGRPLTGIQHDRILLDRLARRILASRLMWGLGSCRPAVSLGSIDTDGLDPCRAQFLKQAMHDLEVKILVT